MTKFKVGDKVRMLDKDSVFAADATINGETYTVIEVYFDGDIRIDDKSGGYPLLINESEFHAIEKITGGDTMNYRTVKRKARVGERILITNAGISLGHYKNGDVLTVDRTGRLGEYAVELEGIQGGNFHIEEKEYEVIIEEPTQQSRKRVDALEVEIETLKGRIATLEKADKPCVTNVTVNCEGSPKSLGDMAAEFQSYVSRALKAPKLTPNQQRKATIERAKEFVEDVRERTCGSVNSDGNYLFNNMATKLSFHVNAEKRVVTALAHGRGSGTLRGKAFAKCAPGDVFNADIGKAIAAGRLYGLDVDEFEQAVQPTEVVAGMVVKSIRVGDVYDVTRFCDDEIVMRTFGRPFRTKQDPNGWLGVKQVNILDDTEAQY